MILFNEYVQKVKEEASGVVRWKIENGKWKIVCM